MSTFTKSGERVLIVDDNNLLHSVSGRLNVFSHPRENKIIITDSVTLGDALNGNSAMFFDVSLVTSPSAANKTALVTALNSIFI